jgi:glucokinase
MQEIRPVSRRVITETVISGQNLLHFQKAWCSRDWSREAAEAASTIVSRSLAEQQA